MTERTSSLTPASVERALKTLDRLQRAAPPNVAARIQDVVELLQAALDRIDPDAQTESPTAPSDAIRDTASSDELPRTGMLRGLIPDPDAMMPQVQMSLDISLSAVQDAAAQLVSGAFGQLTPLQASTARRIRDDSTALRVLSDSLGMLRLLYHDMVIPKPRVFSLAQTLYELHGENTARANEREQNLALEIAERLPLAYADPGHVRQIASAMIDNALRYTPDRGRIQIAAEPLGSQLLVTVTDNGVGLLESDIPQIGTPFWRALHQPIVARQAGAGLRLFISRALLLLNGGELIFSGEEGVGSSFSFTLPITQE
jgi:signal transduction histidine kinase